MTTPLPFSPFIDPSQVDMDCRFVLDAHKFMADIMNGEPAPLFIADPSPEYAALIKELGPIIEACERR